MKRILLLLIILISTGLASDPQIRTFNMQQDFANGDPTGISITSKGELLLAPEIVQLCESPEAHLWDLVCDKNGTLYLSAGNSGTIYTLDRSGKLVEFCKLNEIEIFSLAIDQNNTLYAASSPDGKIYRINSQGTATIYFDPPDTYIWDILFDATNNLFVATGDSGQIYKVSTPGESAIYYKSKESHIRTLAMDNQGNLLAGSFGNGYIYRITSNRDAFVIYDADLKEIHQIAVDSRGIIYAAALGRTKPYFAPKPSSKTQDTKTKDSEGNGATDEVIILDEISVEAREGQRSMRDISESAIYRIAPNGFIRNVWNSFKEPVQSIILSNDDKLFAGTGNDGYLLNVDKKGDKNILIHLDESQISAICFSPQNEMFFATSNLGKIYKVENGFRKEGTYLSEVIDQYIVSKWGSISWEEKLTKGGTAKFYTRTGNTEKPNDTWSNWSPPYTNSLGSNIKNPDSRFIQWKLELTTRERTLTPKVQTISISSLQQNVPPEIASITIYPAGEFYENAQQNIDAKSSFLEEPESFDSGNRPSQRNSRNHYLGRKMFRQGWRTVSWIVVDDNNDNMTYNVFYRETNSKYWLALVKNWQSNAFAWDTQRLPDGKYFLKLEASDSLSNPANLFLKTDRISEPFIIDNTGPDVTNISISTVTGIERQIKFVVKDNYNPVREVAYSIDGEAWKIVYPIDRINDSKIEYFSIQTKVHQTKGKHTLVIKAADTIKNIGFGRTHFED